MNAQVHRLADTRRHGSGYQSMCACTASFVADSRSGSVELLREHCMDPGEAQAPTQQVEEEEAQVTTLQAYREQQAAPEIADTPVTFDCPECGRSFSRPQGLGRHRVSHGVPGVTGAKNGAARLSARSRVNEEPATTAVTLDFTPDELDVIDAVAFIESSTREHVLSVLVMKFCLEQPSEITRLVKLRAERRRP